MRCIINGETIELPHHVRTVAQLLRHFHIHEKIAIVEINMDIVPKDNYEQRAIADGDRIEIVHFVGGG
ncbi:MULTISPECIES: sulfur carrier protein ThiS [Anoxybacillus]|jgi:sulfur carrier protein|uniref:Sulfur carrier protein n=2 Tax=Anoxybacillus TaxID=150247 RepID=A0A1I0T6X1_9BACL|nr:MULTISPECIES: sulfur carrier protein ThiS [Anoxybacillus]EMT46814.1 sulfur carrier protein ThiS [Anoxybacillus flavithermus AK1]MBW7650943.1 sulfur carrier protein ThiS [Anoxybacillus sp. ST4]SFA47437.1 sulfur carrier protein [Anoxybacillus pushchinoensis]